MAWSTPKTDWYGVRDTNGDYIGDRFNAVDFNRIKNNLQHLKELSLLLFENYQTESLGGDRTPSDYFYADEINIIENNLNSINTNTLNLQYGERPIYVENGNTPDYNELNRIEGATLDLYERMTNAINGRRTFTWNFGTKGGDI